MTTYETFKELNNAILITTDVAARGLDVDSLATVIQFDPPKSLETFIHRAGRTARNGNDGQAGVFLTKNEVGICKILNNKGLPVVEKKISEIFTETPTSPLLSEPMDWEEVEISEPGKIGALKKQLKKFERQIQDQISRGLKEEVVRKQYAGAIN